MPLRLEVGALTLEVEHPEEAASLLERLFRYVNNKDLAELLGVTDKTVRRWKREGRLPDQEGGPLTLLQLLQHLDLEPRPAQPGEAPAGAAVGLERLRPRLRPPPSSPPGALSSAPGSGP